MNVAAAIGHGIRRAALRHYYRLRRTRTLCYYLQESHMSSNVRRDLKPALHNRALHTHPSIH